MEGTDVGRRRERKEGMGEGEGSVILMVPYLD